MLPDTPFVEVMALVAVLYGHHGSTATPSEDLLSMLAFRPELFEVGISVVDGQNQEMSGYDIIVADEVWQDCDEKDVSEIRRPPKRRRKRKVLSSSSEHTTTDEEEDVDHIPPKRSKRRSMAEKAEICGDAAAAEGSDEFDEFVRNLSH